MATVTGNYRICLVPNSDFFMFSFSVNSKVTFLFSAMDTFCLPDVPSVTFSLPNSCGLKEDKGVSLCRS